MGQAQNYEKASLNHLLNAMPADQQGPLPIKPFTYTPITTTAGASSNNTPAMAVSNEQDTISTAPGKVGNMETSQLPVHAEPNMVDVANEAYVMVPHVAESEQNQLQRQSQVAEQTQTEVQMETQEPQGQTQLQPQSEPASEPTQEGGKPKKTTRGRPKRIK